MSTRSSARNRSVAFVLLLSVSVLSLGFAQQVVKIGVLAPITGGFAADGEEMVRGARLAVEELNAAGGVAGYTFEVAIGDTRDQQADAVVGAVNRLSSDPQVQVMMTGYASPTNFEIEYMAELQMPYLLSGNSEQTYDIIAPNPDGFPTVWSLTPSYDAYNTALVPLLETLAEKTEGLDISDRTVALISSDNAYSMSIYRGLKENLLNAGWILTLDEVVPFGEVNDWRSLLASVRRDNPNVVINTDYLPGKVKAQNVCKSLQSQSSLGRQAHLLTAGRG